ncbi:MAG: TlpA disulfide reductase family protein, partial [Antricoccus sp.]
LPQIDGTTLAGERLTVPAAVSPTIVVINVWASWCTQCQTESPELGQLAKSLEGQGVSFVGIDEQDTPDAARTFATKVGMAYPQLIDRDGAILAKLTLLPSFGIPSTLVVDRNKHMAARIIGATDASQLKRIIRQVQRES